MATSDAMTKMPTARGSAGLRITHSLNPCTTNAVGPSRRQREGSESGGGGSMSIGSREAIAMDPGCEGGAQGERRDEKCQCWGGDVVCVARGPRQRRGGDAGYRMRLMGMHRDRQDSNRKSSVKRGVEMVFVVLVGRRTTPRDNRPSQRSAQFPFQYRTCTIRPQPTWTPPTRQTTLP